MVRRPPNVAWLGFTPEQAGLLDFLDHVGNNGWDRTSQTDELMPGLLRDLREAGLSIDQVERS